MADAGSDRGHVISPYASIDFDASSTASINSVDSLGRKHMQREKFRTDDKMETDSFTVITINKTVLSSNSQASPRHESNRQRKPVEKHTRQDFLDSIEADPTYMSHFLSTQISEEEKTAKTHANKIPAWAWKIIINVLGVTYSSKDKQSKLSRFIQILTLVIGLTFTVTGMMHEIYDIKSELTNTSLLMGSVNIFIGFIWICMGLYSQKLAARLFSNRNFVECLRLHSRTFLKISVAGIFIFLSIVLMGINSYVSFHNFGPTHCDKLMLNRYVCHVMYSAHIAFTLISTLWNVLVGCTLLSVCRTHTVVIRRFISILNKEAAVLELINKENAKKFCRVMSEKNIDFIQHDYDRVGSGWFIWDDIGSNGFQYSVLEEQPTFTTGPVEQGPGITESQQSEGPSYDGFTDSKSSILTNEEILNAYWKISKRMRVTSRYLQRWLGSWIFFIVLWISDYVITWLSHPAEIFAILECLLPMFILLLLSSAFAEVNGEGQRMIRCICPTSERLKLLQFLTLQPLQMQVFNFALNYNAIIGVVLAFSVAFASRLILDEIRP